MKSVRLLISLFFSLSFCFLVFSPSTAFAITCTSPTTEVCGNVCCLPGHCAYCGCDKPLDWDGAGCGCSECPTCSNSVTCGGVYPEYTYNSSGTGSGYGSTNIPSWTYTKSMLITNVANNSCAYEWPTWSNWGGQDDIIWHGKTGFTTYGGSNAAYSLIPLSTQHTIQWYDSLINVHTYINSRATFCGSTILTKCYGNFSVSSGTYSKSSGSSRFNSMTVTGTAVFAQTGGDLIVSTCD